MRIVRLSLSVLLVLFFSSVASALEFSGQSNSYLFSSETSDGTHQLPFYEYLNFNAEDLGSPSISFHFGGWYRYDFQDETFGTKSSSDLQYAYLRFTRD